MCGEIRKSPDARTAVQWAIAYAKSFEPGPDYQRDGEPLPGSEQRAFIAREFIDLYVPADQREDARRLLAEAPSPLETTVRYWHDVVDTAVPFSRLMGIAGSKVHDLYDDYEHRSALSEEPVQDWPND